MINAYSIRDLEVLSGIKSHTIRIWEQRYALLEPKRTDTNIRYYNDEDLCYLLQVALLNDNGLRISKIAEMNNEEINDSYTSLILNNSTPDPQINGLVSSMIDLDERLFNEIFDKNVQEIGLQNTIVNIIYPFLNRIGMLWITNKIKPIQEHFVLNLIRQKIVAAIDGLPLPNANSSKCLLFTPEKEYHEIGLLLSQFILKQAGYNVYYAGVNVPVSNIEIINSKINFDFSIVLMTIFPAKNKLQGYVKNISHALRGTKLFMCGYQARFVAKVPDNVKVWQEIDNLVDFIESNPHSPKGRGSNRPSGASE